MKQRHAKTVRLTIDFPAEQHAYLKMLAAKKGISMRQYVIEALFKEVEAEETRSTDLSKKKFRKSLDKVIKENDDLLRRLADT